MAFLTESSYSTGRIHGFAGVFAALREGWQRHAMFRRTYNELSALSGRELADLGISRSMITRLACEAAYGKSA